MQLLNAIIMTVFVGSGVIYFLFLVGVSLGFQRVIKPRPNRTDSPSSDRLPFVSVIIPARNEAESIYYCLTSLRASDYPRDRFEIIVADDHSTDDTRTVVETLIRSNQNEPHDTAIRYCSVRGSDSGKSAALNAGIDACRGSIILTTDADCTVSTGWISSSVNHISETNPLVAGSVFYREGTSLFEHLQSLEFFGLVMVGAGSIGLGHPTICNSANLCYSKDLVTTLAPDGFPSKVASDERMLQDLSASSLGQPLFNADPSSFVTAQPVPTLSVFFRQRQRWARAAALFTDGPARVFVSIIFVFLFLLTVLSPMALIFQWMLPAVIAAWTLKLAADLFVLVPTALHFKKTRLLHWFLPAELLHAPYIIIATIAGFVMRNTWKDR